MAQYYYRYFNAEGKVAGAHYMTESEVAHLHKFGRVNLWAGPNSDRYIAKPRNILVVPQPFAKAYHYTLFIELVKHLPATVDLRTVNIIDYPEFFI